MVWDGGAENYASAAAYCSACLVDDNEAGADKVKSKCHLPVKSPGGGLNHAGMAAAAAALAGARGGYQGPDKQKAAKKLLGYYRQENMTPPDTLKALAAG
jgi:hypothetical protein